MRRLRKLILAVATLSLLLGPMPRSDGQVANAHGWRVDAIVNGFTEGGDPAIDPMHRVSSDGFRGVFHGVAIRVVIDCVTEDGHQELVEANVRQSVAPLHAVHFSSDDDVTDGFGEIYPTDTDRRFSTAFGGSGSEVRDDDPIPNPAEVDIRIVEGRYHRLLGVVAVDLSLDIRVERLEPDPGLQCETRTERYVPVRLLLELVVDDDDTDPLDGFIIVGAGSRHEPGERNPIRTICEYVPDTTVPERNRPCAPDQP